MVRGCAINTQLLQGTRIINGGNTFAFFSQQTVQWNLVGAHVELQPQVVGQDQGLSVIAFAGESAKNHRAIDIGDDVFTGLSALFFDPEYGSFSLNGIANFRDEQAGLRRRDQNVVTAAGGILCCQAIVIALICILKQECCPAMSSTGPGPSSKKRILAVRWSSPDGRIREG
jgi:hypothetical protein